MANIRIQNAIQMVRNRRNPNRIAQLGEHPSPNTQARRNVLVENPRDSLAGKKRRRRRVQKQKSKRKSYKKSSRNKGKTAKRKMNKKRRNKSKRKKR